jgi:hypothetical protein
MKTILNVLLIFFLFNNPLHSYSQDKLNQSKNELKSGKSKKTNSRASSEERRSGRSGRRSTRDDTEITAAVIEAVARMTLFVTYHSLIGNHKIEEHFKNDLTDYPYLNSVSSGNYEYLEVSPRKKIRLELENSFLTSFTDIYGNHLKVKCRASKYFYLQSDYFQLIDTENRDDNNSSLALFNFNLGYDRLRFEKVNVGWTLGIKYAGSDVKETGASFGLNMDIFLGKPISLYTSMRWGVINTVPVNEFELKLKYHKTNHFLSFGYEHAKIGTPNYHFLSAGAGIYL